MVTRTARAVAVAGLITSFTVAASPVAPPTHVVVGFYDGMQVRTANVVAAVEVRALSYGPGACTTHITANDKTVIMVAPLGVYGSWKPVFAHTGAIGVTLGKRDQCDTGTELQVRYWKP